MLSGFFFPEIGYLPAVVVPDSSFIVFEVPE